MAQGLERTPRTHDFLLCSSVKLHIQLSLRNENTSTPWTIETLSTGFGRPPEFWWAGGRARGGRCQRDMNADLEQRESSREWKSSVIAHLPFHLLVLLTCGSGGIFPHCWWTRVWPLREDLHHHPLLLLLGIISWKSKIRATISGYIEKYTVYIFF